MRILVVGAGAVGGYFGGRLHEAGRDVSFLVHSTQAETLRTHGLRILSPFGDATIRPRLVLAPEISGPYDLILLCVKAYSLDAAMNDFARAVGSSTMILPLLNGMRHIDLLANRFADGNVIGGVCLIVAEMDKDSRILQLTKTQQLVYGERGGKPSARIETLNQTMQGAKFEAKISQNIEQEMWEKWVMLSSLGAATCLMRGNIGEIEAVTGGAGVAMGILNECSAIAAACGHAPSDAFLTRAEKTMTASGSTLTSSMYRDLMKKGRVEVDQILGDLLSRGRKLGLVTPLVEAAYVNLRIYQARLAGK
jgi:2-dehydropantoate 2-reductase